MRFPLLGQASLAAYVHVARRPQSYWWNVMSLVLFGEPLLVRFKGKPEGNQPFELSLEVESRSR